MENIKKAQTPETFKVTVKKVFDPKQGQFGETMDAVVSWNGDDHYLTFKPKNYGMAKPGNVIMLARKLWQGKPFFEMFLDSGTSEEKLSGSDMPWDRKEDGKDDTQARIMRAQSLNIAIKMVGEKLSNVSYIDQAKNLLEAAKAINETVSGWVATGK